MFKGHRYIHLAIVTLFIFFSSCEEDNLDSIPVVIPEQVLFVGGEQVRLAGRLVATQNQPVTEHGFSISTDASFSNPITISLGERTTPGRFIGETNGLISGQLYYWKPFTIIDGEQIEGETREFTTLLPEITSFSPLISVSGQFLFIEGRNFTSDSRVLFGNVEAEVRLIETESTIQVVIPEIDDSKFVQIKVLSQDRELIAEQMFEYVVGKWELRDNFITPFNYLQTISFLDGDTFFFGLGFESTSKNPILWSLDIPNWTWSESAYSNILLGAFAGPSYFGSGNDELGVLSDEFVTYENGEFLQMNALPFQLSGSISFNINGNIFVLGGEKVANADNLDVYVNLNDGIDEWTMTNRLEVSINSDYPNFVYGDYGYFITADGLVYRFDPSNSTASVISVFPSSTVANGLGVSQVLGDKAYVGLFERDRTMWEYDITNNSWKQKAGFSGGFLESTAVASFSSENVIYILRNPINIVGDGISIWTFKPEEF